MVEPYNHTRFKTLTGEQRELLMVKHPNLFIRRFGATREMIYAGEVTGMYIDHWKWTSKYRTCTEFYRAWAHRLVRRIDKSISIQKINLDFNGYGSLHPLLAVAASIKDKLAGWDVPIYTIDALEKKVNYNFYGKAGSSVRTGVFYDGWLFLPDNKERYDKLCSFFDLSHIPYTYTKSIEGWRNIR